MGFFIYFSCLPFVCSCSFFHNCLTFVTATVQWICLFYNDKAVRSGIAITHKSESHIYDDEGLIHFYFPTWTSFLDPVSSDEDAVARLAVAWLSEAPNQKRAYWDNYKTWAFFFLVYLLWYSELTLFLLKLRKENSYHI